MIKTSEDQLTSTVGMILTNEFESELHSPVSSVKPLLLPDRIVSLKDADT